MFSAPRSFLNSLREKHARPSKNIDFYKTGQLTPAEFVTAGHYLKEKFGMWDWVSKDELDAAKITTGFEIDKFVLVHRGLPCRRRLDLDNTRAWDAPTAAEGGDSWDSPNTGDVKEDEDGWLKTGELASGQDAGGSGARATADSRNIAAAEPDDIDDIPDMEEEMEEEENDNEALPPKVEPAIDDEMNSVRYYDVFISYSALYQTPRLWLAGSKKYKKPLSLNIMMKDIMGDYKNTTVTPEKFPHMSPEPMMISFHACKHDVVMKSLMERANMALKRRREKQRSLLNASKSKELEGLAGDLKSLKLAEGDHADEWEVVEDDDDADPDEVAIRVDQYLVVFLKFMASVIPDIEIDNTMAI